MRSSRRSIRLLSVVMGLTLSGLASATGLTSPFLIATAQNQCSSCFWFSSTPTFTQNGSYMSFHTTLSSNLNRSIAVVIYVIVRNSSTGQTVVYSTGSGILPASSPANSNLTVILVVPNLLPGVYVATFWAESTDGTVSSGSVTILFTVNGSSSNSQVYPLGTQTLTIISLTSPPAGICLSWCSDITYQNNMDASISVVVNLAFHNSIGQTVFMERVAESIGKGQTATAHLSVSGLAPGTYSAEIFAVSSGGVAISGGSIITVTL